MDSPNLVPVLDRAEALRRVGGDEALMRELATLFLADVPRLLQLLRASIAVASPKGLRQAAHAFKGSASQVGALAIVQRVCRLEQMGRDGNLVDAEIECLLLEEDVRQAALVLGTGTKSDPPLSKD